MSIPLAKDNSKGSINTSIIAIKRQIERINALLGLSNSEEIDTSIFATKTELEDAVTQVETDLAPVDEVTVDNMQSVTSNAVANAFSYSTSEINTGTRWIDGSIIYRQVLEFNEFTLIGNNTWNDTGISVGSRNRVITCKGVNATGTLFTIGGCALDIGTTIHLLNYRPDTITITKLILEYTKA